MKLDIYVNYAGKCEEAFRFYEQHLGGKITMMMTHEQQPNQANVPANRKKAILHARIEIGKTVLMGADIPGAEPMRSGLSDPHGRQRRGSGTFLRTPFRRRSNLHEDGRDLFRVSLCHAPGQVRHVLDAAPRTSTDGAPQRERQLTREPLGSDHSPISV